MSIHKSLGPLFGLLLAAVACGPAINLPPTPTRVPAGPAATPTSRDAACCVSATPVPTAGPSGLLPAPLYFIAAHDQQIWRIERDGSTSLQITHEPASVTYFDLSPVDGALVYVSSNDLIRADALGGGRAVLVDGIDLSPENFTMRINNEITRPHWSPDGTQISYGLNGVNILPAGGGQAQVLLQSDLSPELTGETNHPQATFYFEGLWSPDGARLLVQFGYWQEGGGYLIKSLTDGTSAEINFTDYMTCCSPAWTPDSQAIYFSNDSVGWTAPGLWRVGTDGTVETIVAPADRFASPSFALFKDARLLGDGQLYYFFNPDSPNPDQSPGTWPPSLSMTRSGPDGVSSRIQLRTDSVYPMESVWASDGSGAAVVAYAEDSDQLGFTHGPLVWLDTADSPAVPLPGDGFQLRWGK